ncbi:MAG: glycosyltransferase family 2 protein [Rhodanobacteraceae bacterium]|nr:glycosyltransferase family 2 protein [Rhodanobacteraceae bacterium]MBP9153652.1 glycosyltransferase family 2 protein [Xanthomonadales bacterium]
MARISVVIPSRLQGEKDDPAAPWFVERAIACVLGQSIFQQGFTPEILIGVDPGMAALGLPRIGLKARLYEAPIRLQAAALNVACAHVSGDYVAFLEDDDLWEPRYLERALAQIGRFGFVSSTQLERSIGGVVVKIIDYATPSSWVMPRATFDRIGGFDESYRWHLDSEWIGRLNEQRIPRLHFVEATAPIELDQIRSVRILLANIIECAGDSITLLRHESPWPLVMRTVHPGSGMAQIQASEAKLAQSQAECQRLQARFGNIPW